MPNQLSVEICIKREDVEDILSDSSVTSILVQGSIDITSPTTYEWNIKATGYSAAEAINNFNKPTCPQPCP